LRTLAVGEDLEGVQWRFCKSRTIVQRCGKKQLDRSQCFAQVQASSTLSKTNNVCIRSQAHHTHTEKNSGVPGNYTLIRNALWIDKLKMAQLL